MGRKLEVGDRVLCRYFNTPEGKFYDDYFEAEILEVKGSSFLQKLYGGKQYRVSHSYFRDGTWLHRKEIKRRIE